jgi:hypothetical protein
MPIPSTPQLIHASINNEAETVGTTTKWITTAHEWDDESIDQLRQNFRYTNQEAARHHSSNARLQLFLSVMMK